MSDRHFLTVGDYSSEVLMGILEDARELKTAVQQGNPHPRLAGKTLAMIFQKPSTRTRVSFEVGMYQLGGHALMLKEEEIGMGKRESIADVSRVLSRYVDAVMIRPFYHSDITEYAQYSRVPVINGLSDLYHPCQVCADMLTILEHKGAFSGLNLCYIGDGNNVCNSLITMSEKLGINLTVCCPPGYEPTLAHLSHAYTVNYDPEEAIVAADVVYTDVWVSMSAPGQEGHGTSDFVGYTVTENLLANADPAVIFMHCLPAHRGEEVEAAVVDGSASVVFDQAENRLHAQKAILSFLFD